MRTKFHPPVLPVYSNRLLWNSLLLFVVASGPVYAQEVSVSVLYFDNTTKSKPYAWLQKGLSDMLTTDLSKSSSWRLVERENLQKLIKEQQLSESGLVDPASSIRIGKLLSAGRLVYGSFLLAGNSLRIDAKFTDTSTGKIVVSVSAQGDPHNVFDLEKKIARDIFTKTGQEVPADLEIKESESIGAVQRYYEGLEFLDNGNMDAALKKFTESAALDPLYARPQRGIEESYRYLKNFKLMRQQREINAEYRKAEALRNRLSAKSWLTYADLVQKQNLAAMSDTRRARFNKENDVYMRCQTPAHCTWELMWVYNEIASKVEEYRGDTETHRKFLHEMVRLGEASEKKFPIDDPFSSEIRYTKVFAIRWLEDWPRLKLEAERFLELYPDYRLVEFIEDMLELSLKKLEGKE